MKNLPLTNVMKKYSDGYSIVKVRGKIEVAENFNDPLIDDVTIVSEDGSQKGYIANVPEKSNFVNHNGQFVRFTALTYPNVEHIILLPLLSKRSLF